MPFKYETTRRVESTQFPGVSIVLKKMTEGRRAELRRTTSPLNRQLMSLYQQQGEIEKAGGENYDRVKWLELQDQVDALLLEEINPAWVKWGVKMIEGLEADGKPLSLEDLNDWPSELVNEIVEMVKAEAELNGLERKNSELPTTSGALEASSQNSSTAQSAEKEDTGEIASVAPTTQSVM